MPTIVIVLAAGALLLSVLIGLCIYELRKDMPDKWDDPDA